jgi:hypothetical protein
MVTGRLLRKPEARTFLKRLESELISEPERKQHVRCEIIISPFSSRRIIIPRSKIFRPRENFAPSAASGRFSTCSARC